jgi:hypothetical protein
MARREMYVGESFRAFVIRRGWSFWTGRKFDLAPYTAKLFESEADALLTIDRLGLDSEDESASVRRVSLKMQD